LIGDIILRNNPNTSWKTSSNPTIDPSCAVAPTASVIGNVTIGKNVNVAPGASIRSDEGEYITIGNDANIQDNAVIHCLKGGEVIIGDNVSLAHCAIVHGPVTIGEGSFVGFGAVVASSTLGKHVFVSHNATIMGVTITDGKYVPPGTVIQTKKEADMLADVPRELAKFNDEVFEVNCELAKGYRSL